MSLSEAAICADLVSTKLKETPIYHIRFISRPSSDIKYYLPISLINNRVAVANIQMRILKTEVGKGSA